MSENSEVTIFDVAEAAGVSITTVSRILNNKPDVAESTRQRVQKVIDELGFIPHAQAQRLASRKSRTIALLFPLERAVSPLEQDFIVGGAAAAGEENFFFNFITAPITESSLLNLYRSAQVDGIILMEIHLDDWRVKLLRDNDFPFVMIGRCADNEGLNFVDLDFDAAIVTAFDHLVELGHRQIGFLALPAHMREQQYGPAIRSLTGYERARQKHGLDVRIWEVNIAVEDMFEATLDILDEQPDLTALVAMQGSPTVGVIRALRQAGRTVPDDFSVVGFATANVAELITPPLTVIDFPAFTMGYQAAKMLIDQINKNSVENGQILLPSELIVRKSTKPINAVISDSGEG